MLHNLKGILMLAVVLEFDVIEGMENEFRDAWIETTEVIYQNFGSLGSRLHKSDNGKFIAYAQWPDLNVYENDHNWSVDFKNSRERMRASLKIGKPTVLHKLTLDTDLLKKHRAV
jgi:hypothetical protein